MFLCCPSSLDRQWEVDDALSPVATGVALADVPLNAASMVAALERVDEPTKTMHPADARVI
jgi:hypothetical protein